MLYIAILIRRQVFGYYDYAMGSSFEFQLQSNLHVMNRFISANQRWPIMALIKCIPVTGNGILHRGA